MSTDTDARRALTVWAPPLRRADTLREVVLPALASYAAVDEILVLHARAPFKFNSSRCRVAHLHEPAALGDPAVRRRVRRRARNAAVLSVNGDALPSEAAVNALFDAWRREPQAVHSLAEEAGVRLFSKDLAGDLAGRQPDAGAPTDAPAGHQRVRLHDLHWTSLRGLSPDRRDEGPLRARLGAWARRAQYAPPNFMIIGASRGGTTGLFSQLRSHPRIHMPARKELCFFSELKNFTRRVCWRDYLEGNFPRRGARQKTGEASPQYLHSVWAPRQIRRFAPRARFIVLLRNPIDRTWSLFHMRRQKRNPKTGEIYEPADDFAAAEAREDRALAGGMPRALITLPSHILRQFFPDQPAFARNFYAYKSLSLYANFLARWLAYFPRKQFLILQSEAFFRAPAAALMRAQDFLGVRRAAHAEATDAERNSVRPPPMPAATRARLAAFFEPHNRRLFELLGERFDWD